MPVNNLSKATSSPESVKKFLEECKKNEADFIDFRFTDIKGVWHHVTYNLESVSEDSFLGGIPFDGSSIPAWQPINQSDMLLIPDAEATSYFMDPFTADPTMILFCDVYDIYNDKPYEKCPRSIAKKALEYLSDFKPGLSLCLYSIKFLETESKEAMQNFKGIISSISQKLTGYINESKIIDEDIVNEVISESPMTVIKDEPKDTSITSYMQRN